MEPGSRSPNPHEIKHQLDLGVTGRAEVTRELRVHIYLPFCVAPQTFCTFLQGCPSQ
uniref:Uncharacterized protein n=2 Tax=Sus scrofa TaxID=9823 RepID=A0A8D0JHI5_PIG